MTLHDLKLRLRALVAPRTVEREISGELAFHIECETLKHIANGVDPAEARRLALIRFGSVPLVADQCRDERGIAFFVTLARDLAFALRTHRRAPLVALTVVSTIALGLGVVAVAFTFFNQFFFRVDAVKNPEELFAVERPTHPGSHDEIPFTPSEFEALRRDTRVFADVAAARGSVPTRIDGRAVRGVFVSGSFFDMLGVAAARGRTLLQADNEGGGRPFVVLSHLGWQKLFAADTAVIGRQLFVNGHPYRVAGVMPEDFRGLSLEPQDYWAPLALLDQFRGAGASNQATVDVIGRLPPGTSPEAASAALSAWASAQPGTLKSGNGIVHVILRESRGVLSEHRGEAMAMFMPVLFAFGLILMIGCANVANLLLARGLSRQREFGVRLSLGATRGQIVRQLFTENLVLALAAAALGFLVSRVLLAGSIHLMLSVLPPEFAESLDVVVPPGDWRVSAFLFGGAIISTLLFGLAPALHATRLELIRAMRGEVTRDGRPSRVRQMLIGSQVTASALLLVCAAVFLRSTYSAATAEIGVRTDDNAVITGITESTRPALLHAIRQHPSIASVAASWPEPMHSGEFVQATAGETKLSVDSKLVSPEYFDLLGIPVLRGRLFAADERSPATGVVVISEGIAQRFWPKAEALGQKIRVDSAPGQAARNDGAPQIPAQLFTVIGVVRDVRSGLKMFDFSYSGIYLPTRAEQSKVSLILRVHGDPDAARRALLDALTKVDPALGEITTMKMVARLGTAVLKVVFWLAVILSSLALALTVSGLFSVLTYLVEQRRPEIGVRLALGATAGDILALVVSQAMRPIAAGVLIGIGLAPAVAIVLLSTPLADTIGTLVRPFDPLAYAASLVIVVATCVSAAFLPARRAANIDPMATLRAD